MDVSSSPILRDQLVTRRERLVKAIAATHGELELAALLQDVDAALARMDKGTYGICETCHDPIEAERLLADPLVRLCLDHLTPAEQRALEHDLELASRIQRELLPRTDLSVDGWEIAYRYQPRGLVSGDYCDVITTPRGDFYFMIGDVSGKGVAASMLMAHLHAILRTLASLDLPLGQLMERASHAFCESTLPTHYATMVCGRADASGSVEICNAGHPPPLLLSRGDVTRLDATGLPLGMFCNERFTTRSVRLDARDTFLLYTDGISEMENADGADYGTERLSSVLRAFHDRALADLLGASLRDIEAFTSGAAAVDDRALMAIRRL